MYRPKDFKRDLRSFDHLGQRPTMPTRRCIHFATRLSSAAILMYMYQNQVRLVGFLGANPVQHENHAIFSLVSKTSWKAQDSEKWESYTPNGIAAFAWGKLAEAVTPFAKGDHVQAEGERLSGSYDKELPVVGGGTTIVPMPSWEIRASAVRKLVRKKKPARKPAKALKAAA